MPIETDLPRGKVLVPDIVQVYFDGACQPPKGGGVATYGFTVDGAGLKAEEYGLAVPPWSEHATNNVAEYKAAISALEWLSAQGYRGTVIIHGDSQLVIRQMQGEYEVRADHLRAYHARLQQLESRFERVQFEWVPREENARADELSKLALEEHWQAAGKRRPVTIPRSAIEE
ncbi:MAG: ribonuclease HI, partial [Thermoplasmata archaeon]